MQSHSPNKIKELPYFAVDNARVIYASKGQNPEKMNMRVIYTNRSKFVKKPQYIKAITSIICKQNKSILKTKI
jgi:hypothetical protein